MATKEIVTLDDREKRIEVRQTSILERAAKLTNRKTKQIEVRSQSDADMAGELARDAAGLAAEWKQDWYGTLAEPGDIPKADAMHKSLIKRWRRIDTPLQHIVTSCKNAVNIWRILEQRRREGLAAKLNAKEPGSSGFVHQAERVGVEGMTVTVRYEADLVDKMELIKAVAKGRVDPVFLLFNQDAGDDLAKLKHDMVDQDGYILPGVKVRRTEEMRRKG